MIRKLVLTVAATLATSVGLAGDIFVSVSGQDANTGTRSEPKRTIQAAINVASPGDRIVVGPGTYTESSTANDSYYTGIQITRSGTASAPITIASEVPKAAVIDSQSRSAGFVLWNVSDVVIDGFTIRNCQGGGVYMVHGYPKKRITVVNSDISNCDGPEGSNVGGIYMSSCSECLIRNNSITHIRVGGALTHNAGGIHGYDQELSTIENNRISDAYDGIFHKKSSGNPGLVIRNNTIRDVDLGISYSVQAVGSPAHIDQQVYENVISARQACIDAVVYETATQSRGLTVRNNVFVDCPAAVSLYGMNDVTVQNNIFYKVSQAIVTKYGDWRASVIAESNNLYYPAVSIGLQVYSSNEIKLNSLSSWQTLTGYGAGDLAVDPRFVNAAAYDFHLQSGSPAIRAGSDGKDIGAYPRGAAILPLAPALKVN